MALNGRVCSAKTRKASGSPYNIVSKNNQPSQWKKSRADFSSDPIDELEVELRKLEHGKIEVLAKRYRNERNQLLLLCGELETANQELHEELELVLKELNMRKKNENDLKCEKWLEGVCGKSSVLPATQFPVGCSDGDQSENTPCKLLGGSACLCSTELDGNAAPNSNGCCSISASVKPATCAGSQDNICVNATHEECSVFIKEPNTMDDPNEPVVCLPVIVNLRKDSLQGSNLEATHGSPRAPHLASTLHAVEGATIKQQHPLQSPMLSEAVLPHNCDVSHSAYPKVVPLEPSGQPQQHSYQRDVGQDDGEMQLVNLQQLREQHQHTVEHLTTELERAYNELKGLHKRLAQQAQLAESANEEALASVKAEHKQELLKLSEQLKALEEQLITKKVREGELHAKLHKSQSLLTEARKGQTKDSEALQHYKKEHDSLQAKVAELESQVSVQKDRAATLHARLHKTQNKLNELQKERTNECAVLEQQQQKILGLQRNNSQLEEQTKQLQKDLGAAANQFTTSSMEHSEALAKHAQQLQACQGECSRQVQESQQTASSLANQVTDLTKENTALQGWLEQAQKQTSSFESLASKLHESLAVCEREYQHEKAAVLEHVSCLEMEVQFRAQHVEKLENFAKQIEAEKAKLRDTLALLECKLSDLTTQLHDTRAELQRSQHDLNASREEHKIENISSAKLIVQQQAQLRATAKQLKLCFADCTHLQQQCNQLSKTCSVQHQQVIKLQQDTSHSLGKSVHLQHQVKQAEEQSEASLQRATIAEERCTQFQTKLCLVESALQKQESEASVRLDRELKKAHDLHELKLKEAKEEHEKRWADQISSSAAGWSFKQEQWAAENQELQKVVHAARQQLSTIQCQSEQLQKRIAMQEGQLLVATTETADLVQQRSILEERLKLAEQKAQAKEQETAEAAAKYNKVQTLLTELTEQMQVLRAELAQHHALSKQHAGVEEALRQQVMELEQQLTISHKSSSPEQLDSNPSKSFVRALFSGQQEMRALYHRLNGIISKYGLVLGPERKQKSPDGTEVTELQLFQLIHAVVAALESGSNSTPASSPVLRPSGRSTIMRQTSLPSKLENNLALSPLPLKSQSITTGDVANQSSARTDAPVTAQSKASSQQPPLLTLDDIVLTQSASSMSDSEPNRFGNILLRQSADGTGISDRYTGFSSQRPSRTNAGPWASSSGASLTSGAALTAWTSRSASGDSNSVVSSSGSFMPANWTRLQHDSSDARKRSAGHSKPYPVHVGNRDGEIQQDVAHNAFSDQHRGHANVKYSKSRRDWQS